MSTNDITGDALRTKPASDAYRDNFDAIFRCGCKACGKPTPDGSVHTCSPQLDWPEDDSRIDKIGQNGGDGLHYGH